MRQRRGWSRRQFLAGIGGLAAALPLLQLHHDELRADGSGVLTASGFPRRLIVFFHPNGTRLDAWFPTAGSGERDFVLGPIHGALAGFRDRLIFTQGIDMKTVAEGPGGPHQKGMGTVLTAALLQEGEFVDGDGSMAGWADGVSIDQVIAEHVGASNPYKSLELGIRADTGAGSDVRSRLSYAGPGMPLPPQNDPRLVFQQLFADQGAPAEGTLLRRQQRKSVLDGVQAQFMALQSRLGQQDRERLATHQQLVRDLELRLENDPVLQAGCGDLLAPGDAEPDSEDTMPVISRTQIDLLVMAMACDLTRVGSLQYSNAINRIRFPWVDGLTEGHSLSHMGPTNTDARDEIIRRDAWLSEQLAYLLTQLDAVPEGDGTMLDNTAVLWVNELAEGNTHLHANMPFLLAGSAGGVFDTGRFVQYSGQPHSNLLLTLALAFGVDIDSFGHPDFCTGPLAGLV